MIQKTKIAFALSEEAVRNGYSANNMMKYIQQEFNGKGGGSDYFAEGVILCYLSKSELEILTLIAGIKTKRGIHVNCRN